MARQLGGRENAASVNRPLGSPNPEEVGARASIALFENDVTKFCTYACWDTNADKDYVVALIIVPLLREKT